MLFCCCFVIGFLGFIGSLVPRFLDSKFQRYKVQNSLVRRFLDSKFQVPFVLRF